MNYLAFFVDCVAGNVGSFGSKGWAFAIGCNRGNFFYTGSQTVNFQKHVLIAEGLFLQGIFDITRTAQESQDVTAALLRFPTVHEEARGHSDWKHIDERYLEGRRRHVLEELAVGGT